MPGLREWFIMVIVARTQEVDRVCGGSFRALLSSFASRLSDQDSIRNVVVTSICPRDLTNSDVFGFVARVGPDGLEGAARQALDAWSQSNFLIGKVAFCVLIGDRPSDFGPQYGPVS